MGQIQATLSLYSLQAYLLDTGRGDLFSGLTFPDGINKELACDVIMTESMQFELLYTDPDFLTPMITTWGKKWLPVFEKWYKGVTMDYDPIYNYDRYEEWTDGKTENRTRTDNLTETDDATRTDNLVQTNNLTRTDDLTRTDNLKQTDSRTETAEVTAYEAGTLYTHDKTTNGGSLDNTGTVKNGGTVKDTGDVKNTGTQRNNGTKRNTGTVNDAGTENGTHNGHIYGNIGVKTSSEILAEYLEQSKWNLYEHIADVFIKEFCIMVY